MRILEIEKCGSPHCPFFKEIVSGDNGDDFLGLCNHDKRYITESDRFVCDEESVFESDLIFTDDSFPNWCFLTDLDNCDLWEIE
jgi:hypothetical protein